MKVIGDLFFDWGLGVIFVALGLGLALGSCSREREQGPRPGGGVVGDGQISLRVSMGDVVVADRATGSERGSGSLLGGLPGTRGLIHSFPLTGVRFYKIDAATEPSDFTGGQTTLGDIDWDGNVTFQDPFFYNTDNNLHAWILAYHPGDILPDENDGNAVSFPIDGKTDALWTNPNVNSHWDAGTIDATVSSGFKLEHLHSQVMVICKAGEAGDENLAKIRQAWGQITKIEIETSVKVYFGLDDFSLGATESNFLPLLSEDLVAPFAPMDIPEQNNIITNAAAIVASGSNGFDLKIYTDLFPLGKLIRASVTLEANKIHTITLTFTAEKEIKLTGATVTPWVPLTSDDNIVVPD